MKAIILFFILSNSHAYLIDAKGTDGTDGKDGADSSNQYAPGQDAGPSTTGRNGKLVDITLSTTDETIQISGSHSGIFRPNERETLIIDARGGKGGNGGNGGRGYNGDNGRSGSSSHTPNVPGQNGEDGQNGSHGGQASAGSAGGNGGTVQITVGEDDLYLLGVVATPQVSGGRGGTGGRGGVGGRGGAGGSGGSGHTWQEPYADTCQKMGTRPGRENCSTSISGNGVASRTCSQTTETYYYTESCTKYRTRQSSSGSSGSSGRDGLTMPNAPNGRDGQKGSYVFRVLKRDGTVSEYSGTFDLELISFQIESELGNTFFEPEEIITLNSIQIKNNGPMPSPAGKISLFSDKILGHLPKRISSQIFLPRIEPGQTVILKSAIQFPIPEVLGPDEIVKKAMFGIQAKLGGLSRTLSRFAFQIEKAIRYPVELLSLTGNQTLAPGERQGFDWAVKNHGKKTLSKEDGRVVYISFSAKPLKGLRAEELIMESGGGFETPTRFDRTKSLTLLPERVFTSNSENQINLMFSENTEAFEKASLTASLYLEKLRQKNSFSKVGEASLEIRSGKKYTPQKDSEILLVIGEKL